MIDPTQPLIVMYHYVHHAAPPEPSGVRPLLASEFEAQLDALSERYDIVGADEFLARLASPGERPACLLTFDDGTVDHAEVATPILARRGLSGVFFVLSGPAEDGWMPLAHAIHWALSAGDEAVWRALSDAAAEAGVSPGEEDEARKIYHYEAPLRARIKYAANFALPQDVTAEAIGRLAASRGKSMRALAREWFVSAEQVADMREAGMTIGVHGRTHLSLQQMGEAVADEIAHCADFVRRATGEAPSWWACPFGGSGADAAYQAMYAAMAEHGLTAGVSTVARTVAPGDLVHALPRIDCVRLPPKAPL